MSASTTLDGRSLTVQNQRQGSGISSLDAVSSPSYADNERGDRIKVTITTEFIVKHHIFPSHKFITSPDDLRFDKTTGGKTICAIYLDKPCHGRGERGGKVPKVVGTR